MYFLTLSNSPRSTQPHRPEKKTLTMRSMTNRPTPRTTNPPRIHYSYSPLFRAELCPYRLSCINVTSFQCTTTCQNCPEEFLKACSRPQAFPSRRSTFSISSVGTRVPHPACSTVVAPPCRASLPVHPFHPLDSSPSLPRSSLHRPGISTVETVLPPGEVPGVALGAVPRSVPSTAPPSCFSI